jgi:Fe-S oxidoreductase
VDVARFKSEFLADYYARHGTPLEARVLGNASALAKVGSRLAPLANWVVSTPIARRLNESLLGLDARRALPRFQSQTLRKQDRKARGRAGTGAGTTPDVLLFADTFTNHYDPEIGVAALDVLRASGLSPSLAPNQCCGRPQISKGLLPAARDLAVQNTARLYAAARDGVPLVFCEPSCLSAIREDVPALLRGDQRRRAEVVASTAVLFDEFVAGRMATLPLRTEARTYLLHGHCHQKSMGLVPATKALLSALPGATVVDVEAGCCGMAGSFGYAHDHYEVSRAIGERKLFPAVRGRAEGTVVVASGTSCRHQIHDFTGTAAAHPATIIRSLLKDQDPA